MLQSLDEIDVVEAALVEVGISHEPQPTDLDRLSELVDQRPELDPLIRRVEELVRQLADPSIELRDALDSRSGTRQAPGLVMAQLLAQTDAHAESVSNNEIDGLEVDLGQQRDPLSSEIQAWAHLTGEPIGASHASDHEENAPAFARVLARLREPDVQGTSTALRQTATQVSAVIRAIANDADLRAHVFSLAQDALGTCGDNLVEGFSKICLVVDNHQMAKAVERGQVNAKQLQDWAVSLFRLSLLESAVHRFIESELQRPDLPEQKRNALTHEPLETMLHAKVALRQPLGLPGSTVSRMTFRSCSVLGLRDLRTLEQQVKTQAEDGQEHGKFLLGHSAWRTGMKTLNRQSFENLKANQEKDPFFDLDVPADLEGQAEYAAEAARVRARHADEENALLLDLATRGA